MKLISFFSHLYKHIKNCEYDFIRFRNYSAYRKIDSIGKLMPLIQWDAHIIEKGLSLESPRPFFGISVFERISERLELYIKLGGNIHAEQIQAVLDVLISYKKFNQSFITPHICQKHLEVIEKVNDLITKYQVTGYPVFGGTIEYSKEEFNRQAKGDWISLSQSRFSMRHFTGEKISAEAIEQAVNLSRKTPSVCNRQSVRVSVVINDEKIQNILAIQGGAGGFKEKVAALLIVCGDLNSFSLVNERNQVFIDIGFFSMSLLYSFHYLGYGACPLHWFFGKKQDTMLRKIIDIPPSWTVGNLIVVGCIPDKFKVPMGHRLPLSQILKYDQK